MTAHQIGVNAVSWRPVDGRGGKKQFVTGGCDKMV